jgi:hypothetical protein
MRRSLQAVLLVLGIACVAVGLLGIAVPVLPTTPLLLLAAFLFARSSPRCHHWLLTNPLCGDYVRRYLERRAMRRRHKILTLALLWVGIGCSIAFATSTLWLRLILAAVAIAVTIHVMLIQSE